MTIKAKFLCESIKDHHFSVGSNRIVEFRAVYGQAGENASYAKATPWGELKMQIDKETAAHDAFVPGKEYYLTIEAV